MGICSNLPCSLLAILILHLKHGNCPKKRNLFTRWAIKAAAASQNHPAQQGNLFNGRDLFLTFSSAVLLTRARKGTF